MPDNREFTGSRHHGGGQGEPGGTRAMGVCEPGQGGNAAAISNTFMCLGEPPRLSPTPAKGVADRGTAEKSQVHGEPHGTAFVFIHQASGFVTMKRAKEVKRPARKKVPSTGVVAAEDRPMAPATVGDESSPDPVAATAESPPDR